MGLFNLFGKESSTKYETTNTFTDKSVNAGDGSVAVGEGANVHIEDLSAGVAEKAIGETADTARFAVAANSAVNIASLDTTSRLANAAINTVAGMGEIASRERVDVLQTTNTALQSQKGVTDKLAELASGALERSQTPDSQVTKTLLWVVGGVAVFFGLLMLGSTRKRQ